MLTKAETYNLPVPGIVGRGIRIGLGLLTLYLFVSLSSQWRIDLLSGHFPVHLAFIFVLGWALGFSSPVIRVFAGEDNQWGQKPLLILLSGALFVGGLGYLTSGIILNSFLGIYVWLWLIAFVGVLGTAYFVSAILGTPGCEMRAYAHIKAKFKKQEIDAVPCAGYIDRLDHLG